MVIFVVCQLLLKHRTAMNKSSQTIKSLLLSSSPVLSPQSIGATKEEGRAPIAPSKEKQKDLNVCFRHYLLSDNLSHYLPHSTDEQSLLV